MYATVNGHQQSLSSGSALELSLSKSMGTLQLWEVTVMQDLRLKIKQCDHCAHTQFIHCVQRSYEQSDVVIWQECY